MTHHVRWCVVTTSCTCCTQNASREHWFSMHAAEGEVRSVLRTAYSLIPITRLPISGHASTSVHTRLNIHHTVLTVLFQACTRKSHCGCPTRASEKRREQSVFPLCTVRRVFFQTSVVCHCYCFVAEMGRIPCWGRPESSSSNIR